MTTAKALIVGLIVTVGLLASSFALEGIAQVLGPEEAEEEVHDEDGDHEGEVIEVE